MRSAQSMRAPSATPALPEWQRSTENARPTMTDDEKAVLEVCPRCAGAGGDDGVARRGNSDAGRRHDRAGDPADAAGDRHLRDARRVDRCREGRGRDAADLPAPVELAGGV